MDGDFDVLVGGGRVAWYENIDGVGTFGVQKIISNDLAATNTAFAADFDGDGDLDVVAHNDEVTSKYVWYENKDGLGSFGTENIITTATSLAEHVYAADLDGDGDMDVLSASSNDDEIAWYANTDGVGTFGVQQIISSTSDFAQYETVAKSCCFWDQLLIVKIFEVFR